MKGVKKAMAVGLVGLTGILNSGCESMSDEQLLGLALGMNAPYAQDPRAGAGMAFLGDAMIRADAANRIGRGVQQNGYANNGSIEIRNGVPTVVLGKIEFEKVEAHYNVFNGKVGEKGIQIVTTFRAHRMLNRDVRINAYFYSEDGEQLNDRDGKYRTSKGHVFSEGEIDNAPYVNTEFGNVQLFMPYSQFDLEGSGRYNLKFRLYGFEVLGAQEFPVGASDYYNFYFDKH